MVKIRLARGGAKKRPFYSIVVTDSRKRRDSAYIERIGYFNPVARGQEVRLTLEEDRLTFWQSKGAQLTDRVSQLVKEFKDPSIREKQLAAKAAKIEAIKAKAEAEAKAAAEAAAAEEAAASAEEAAAAEAEETAEEAETPAEEAAPEAEAEAKEE
jgi:small subunit ribosomal protein S16